MSKVLSRKILRNALGLALVISAVANAPGLLLAIGVGEGGPAVPKGAAPADEYDFQYAAAPMGDVDAGAWLDAFLKTGATAAWSHSWTDFESAPAADTLSRYRRSPHWEPEGVMFAYAPTYTDLREPSAGVEFVGTGIGFYFADFGPGTPRSGSSPQPQGVEDDTPPDADVPDYDPPPSSQPDPIPDPTPDPPVTVPEPASMSLFALGLAGLFMFGKRRRFAGSRGARDRG